MSSQKACGHREWKNKEDEKDLKEELREGRLYQRHSYKGRQKESQEHRRRMNVKLEARLALAEQLNHL